MCVKVIASHRWDVFLGHGVVVMTVIWILLTVWLGNSAAVIRRRSMILVN